MADINSTARIELQVNGKEAEETLSKLRKRARELGDEIVKAMADGDEKGLKKLRKEAKEVDRAIKQIESSTQQAANVLQRLDKSTPRELQSTLKTLEKQLQNMTRGTKEWADQAEKIKRVKGALKEVTEELAYQESFWQKMNGKFNEWGASAMTAAASVAGVVAAGKKAVQAYADMDQEMANVRKYTGMTSVEVEHLNEAFKKMDTRTGREELNKLAQEAGRLGMQSEEDVLGFVKAADKINVALDDLGDGATLTLSKLTDIFGDRKRLGTEQSLLAVGSVINELSQNCTASAPYLAQFAQRLAGVGAQANMTVPQIMAFGAVLDSQGQAVEMSATALSKTITSLFKNTDKVCAATGLNVKQFSELAKKDTNEALLVLLERLHDMGDISALAPIFAEMGENGSRATGVLAALAGNIDQVRAQQVAANDAFTEATSIDKEFNVQNTTVQAGLEKARKGFQEMAVTLGERIMPIVSHLISGTSATMRMLNTTIGFVTEYRKEIITLASAFAAYTAAVKAESVAKKVWTAVTTAARVAQEGFNKAIMQNPLGLVAAAVAAAVAALVQYRRHLKEMAEEHDAVGRAQKQANEAYAESKARIDKLTAVVNNNNLSLKYRNQALKELKQIVPDYHASLTKEGELINDNKDAIDQYLTALKKKMQMQAYQDMLQEQYNKRAQMELQLDEQKVDAEEKRLAWSKSRSDGFNAISQDIKYNKMRKADNKVSKTQNELAILDENITKLLEKIGSNDPIEVPIKPVVDDNKVDVTGSGNGLVDDDMKKKLRDEMFKEDDKWRREQQALNSLAYNQGEKDFEEYTRRNIEIEIEWHKRRRDKCKEGEMIYNEEWAAMLKAERDLAKHNTGLSVEQENEKYMAVKEIIDQRYADGLITNRQYQNALELAELEHLRNMVAIYDEGSAEQLKAQEAYNKRSRQIQERRIKEQKAIQDKLKADYFTNKVKTPDYEGHNEARQNLELVRSQMLQQAKTNAEKLKIEKAYQEAKYLLARKYNVKASDAEVNAFRAAIDRSIDWLNSDEGQAMTQTMSTMVSSMGEIFSGLTDIIQAETEIQTAAIEAKYDKSISAAEGNKHETARLEKEKEEEIARVKSEAADKTFAMEVTMAVAQTAMAAISAYSSAAAIPIVGWIMGPIAAAMAVAAGAIQIASIKKQHEQAKATGYASGGYTKKGGKYEEAGIVHAGEWVASQELLANPAASATIARLDEAQRTNRIGSLDSGMVSDTITAPVRMAALPAQSAAAPASTSSESKPADFSALDRLANRLDQPFVTVATVTGDRGINHEQERYNQLLRNKSPKSKK